jgi:hypothetical protein
LQYSEAIKFLHEQQTIQLTQPQYIKRAHCSPFYFFSSSLNQRRYLLRDFSIFWAPNSGSALQVLARTTLTLRACCGLSAAIRGAVRLCQKLKGKPAPIDLTISIRQTARYTINLDIRNKQRKEYYCPDFRNTRKAARCKAASCVCSFINLRIKVPFCINSL